MSLNPNQPLAGGIMLEAERKLFWEPGAFAEAIWRFRGIDDNSCKHYDTELDYFLTRHRQRDDPSGAFAATLYSAYIDAIRLRCWCENVDRPLPPHGRDKYITHPDGIEGTPANCPATTEKCIEWLERANRGTICLNIVPLEGSGEVCGYGEFVDTTDS
jgi:hypothetical protein